MFGQCGGGYYCVMEPSGTTAECPSYAQTDFNSIDNGQCALNAFATFGFGSSGVACYSCSVPPSTPYTCGTGTIIPSYCNNGPSCISGYKYSSLYSCDPNSWDGCCVGCPAKQTCQYPTDCYSSVPDGNCSWTYCGDTSACVGQPTPTPGGGGGGALPCPRQGDARTYNGTSGCDSSTGLGYNTVGGSFTCKPVDCPGQNTGLPHGNTCIYSSGGHCDAGYGGNGFNPSSSEGGCNFTQLNVACPPKNQIVTINVKTSANVGIGGIGLTVYDNGHGNFTVSTDNTGKAIFASWSGDHFQVWPQANANYTFNKSQGNPIDGVVNTNSSCGTTKGWPNPTSSNSPCVITATSTGYTLSGTLFLDSNNNGVMDAGESAFTGAGNSRLVTATNTTTNTSYTDYSSTTDGTYAIPFLPNGTYTLSTPPPSGYLTTNSPMSVTISNGNATGKNLGLIAAMQISGNVFNDLNKDTKYNGADTPFTGTPSIQITGPTSMSVTANASTGLYATGAVLLPGSYTVHYNSTLPVGSQFTTASTWAVTVGSNCNPGSSPDAVCGNPNGGSVGKLNFGITNENAWQQEVCLDVRNDSGTYNNQIPPAPSCGGVGGAYDTITNGNCSTGAGIVFTCNATPDFGFGSANASNWLAGGPAANQQECFTGAGLNVIRTSYDYLLTTERQSGIIPTDMATVCGAGGIANCTLQSGLPKGIYQANGDVHLNAFTFPVSINNPQSYIFLINGNLYLQGNIIVPAGSVAAFSSNANIYVDKSVGNVISSSSDPAVNAPNLEGLYSADNSFIINSATSGTNLCNNNGTPLDKKLNIVGSVITNASKGGGSFVNNRDLCIYDSVCPAVSVGDGTGSNTGLAVSYLLTLFADGKFLNHQLFNWQELKP